MVKITMNVEGMLCGHCEAHVNDAIRSAFDIKSVSSSHRKNETVIIAAEDIDKEKLKAAVDRISAGFAGEDFSGIAGYFLSGTHSVADPYLCLADFESYYRTYSAAVSDYANRTAWTSKAICNIAGAGYFAADRSISEYADNIWHLKKVTE